MPFGTGSLSPADRRSRLLEYLKHRAPYSVMEVGNRIAADGNVTECVRSSRAIHGAVRVDEQMFSVKLEVISGSEVEAICTCSSREDMHEQWCSHALAVCVRSLELGFFDTHSGFAVADSTYRMNTTSPAEIASVITEAGAQASTAITPSPEPTFLPEVKIALDASSDRLGVRIYFNGEVQAPVLFEGFSQRSSRTLDNLLIKLIDEEGSWDDDKKLWYVNSSTGIDPILGIIQEYPEVVSVDTDKKIRFAKEIIDAKLKISWGDSSAELQMLWVLPDGIVTHKDGDLFGTGPYWASIENVIYRVSSIASRIASIFPHSPSITLTRSQVGPILEALQNSFSTSSFVEIENPELQPASVVKSPKPLLELQRKEAPQEHFSSSKALEILGIVEFNYPEPPADKNLVHLPDREKEREFTDFLKSLGFEPTGVRNHYQLTGEGAINLLHDGDKLFPAPWKVSGIDALRQGMRFVDLSLNVDLSSTRAAPDQKGHGSIDWFDCHVSLVQNNANVPISTLFKSGKIEGDRWILLDSGAYARVPAGTMHQLKTLLGMLDPNFKLSNTIKTKLTTAQAVSLSRMGDAQVQVSLDAKLRDLARKLDDFDAIEKIEVSKKFEGTLRSYQKDGLAWLNFLHSLDLGGILADEMGLGKTVQALALLQHMKDLKGKRGGTKGPALVVAPTSVITNWVYEARRFAPELKVILLHGSSRKAQFKLIPEQDIVITSYALLRMDRFELEKHEFGYILLDEAQNIKNPDAATTKAAKALRAKHRLALTGTPTENRPLELWSIMDFLMPGYLGSLEFFKNYVEKPILEGGPDVGVAKFLNAKTRPFILRRKKAEVEKELPPKLESVLHVEMTESQQSLYSAILEEVRPKIFDAVEKKGVRGASVSILAALLRLRQVCNHPNSIDSLKTLPGYDSGKFNLLKDLVTEAVENGRKILLFSQFREMLLIIRRFLAEASINHLYLDGATRNRQELIDQFNSDESVRLFLISLKAGGTGLNLTAADTVIIYDPWWNPAVESQAVDRAHRIGQKKTVNVYRLVTEASVEQKIMDLKAKKSKIVEALINADDAISVLKLSKADLEHIFSPIPRE